MDLSGPKYRLNVQTTISGLEPRAVIQSDLLREIIEHALRYCEEEVSNDVLREHHIGVMDGQAWEHFDVDAYLESLRDHLNEYIVGIIF